jgi:UDP-glucuronate decarboxylase
MNENCAVICLDNFFTGRKENISRWIGHPNFEYIRHDITERIVLDVDEIYHLACPASPVHYQMNAIRTLKTNVLGTLNICGLAKRSGARLLLASTSEVYGDPNIHPQSENYFGNVNPVGLRSCYDEGKRAAEALCMDYFRQHGVDIRIARIFNTYGPRMAFNDGRVVSNLIVQSLTSEAMSIYGDGSQTRSFCYVSDLVEGLVRLMRSKVSEPVNVGNPGEFPIIELANLVSDITGIPPTLEYRQLPQDDPTRRRPDISKAERMLGWSPTVSIVDGLRLTVTDFKERIARGESTNCIVHQTGASTIPN